MRALTGLVACVIMLTAALPVAAPAQVTVNPYAGLFLADDGPLDDAVAEEGLAASVDPTLVAGLRLGFASESNWGFEGAYGYAPITIALEEGALSFEVDGDVHLYYAALLYRFPTTSATRFFLSGGVGGITITGDEEFFEGAENSSTDLLVNVGAGLTWWVNDRWSLRFDVKDHIELCQAGESEDDFTPCPLDDATLHHFEVSGGVSVQVGGGRS